MSIMAVKESRKVVGDSIIELVVTKEFETETQMGKIIKVPEVMDLYIEHEGERLKVAEIWNNPNAYGTQLNVRNNPDSDGYYADGEKVVSVVLGFTPCWESYIVGIQFCDSKGNAAVYLILFDCTDMLYAKKYEGEFKLDMLKEFLDECNL